MDLYLPDEFYALSETPNPRAAASEADVADDSFWLGGEALVAPLESSATIERARICEPDPLWLAI